MNFFKRLFSFGKKKKEDDVESDVNQSLDSEDAIEEDKLELKNKKIKPASQNLFRPPPTSSLSVAFFQASLMI